jgi:hypothetical protein
MHTVTFQSPIPWGGCLDEDKTLCLLDSERQFYEYLWPSWSKDLAKYGFKVDSTFIWIDKDRPVDSVARLIVVEGQPKPRSIHVGIHDIEPDLAACLSET